MRFVLNRSLKSALLLIIIIINIRTAPFYELAIILGEMSIDIVRNETDYVWYRLFLIKFVSYKRLLE